MTYVQIAARTNHTALTVSPRRKAIIAHATAPSTAMAPNSSLCRVVMGERSMTATGGRFGSVRTNVTSPRTSSIRSGGAAGGDPTVVSFKYWLPSIVAPRGRR